MVPLLSRNLITVVNELLSTRGTFIGLINCPYIYLPGALARAVPSLSSHPSWLMVYGEANEISQVGHFQKRFKTLPPSVGAKGFSSHCFLYQSTVIFRRTMFIFLGPFREKWQTSYFLEYLIRGFEIFPHRIGYIPYTQGCLYLPDEYTNESKLLSGFIEEAHLLIDFFGVIEVVRIQNFVASLHQFCIDLGKINLLQPQMQSLFDNLVSLISPGLLENLRNSFVRSPVSSNLSSIVCELASSFQLYIEPLASFSDRPFGVNLIGYAFEAFGIGIECVFIACVDSLRILL